MDDNTEIGAEPLYPVLEAPDHESPRRSCERSTGTTFTYERTQITEPGMTENTTVEIDTIDWLGS